MSRFKVTRADGRTNAEVVVSVVQQHAAGALLTYDALREALSVGTDRAWSTTAVQAAVRGALPRVRREASRTLVPVTRQGYRVAHASEHSAIALRSERRAGRQVRVALDTLKHVAWDELSPAQRTLHEAHLTITGALCQQVARVTKRQQKHDEAIEALLSRVDRLEAIQG